MNISQLRQSKIGIVQLRQRNKAMKQRVDQLKNKQKDAHKLRSQLDAYAAKSRETINQMNEESLAGQQLMSRKLHEAAQQYQIALKEQISLLTENQQLSERKETQQKRLNEEAEKLTKEYESKIADFQQKVQINVRKIQQMGGTNMIKKLIKNEKFKTVMTERGCNLQGLLKQQQLQEIAEQVQQKDKLIQAAELKSAVLDEELQKMQELIETMKELMENMYKEKENILKQNTLLQEKLVQSEELIGKLLASNPVEVEEEEEEENDIQQDQDEQQEEQGEQEEKLNDH